MYGAGARWPTRAEEDELTARQKLRAALATLPREHVTIIADEARRVLDTGMICRVCGRPWIDGKCSLMPTVHVRYGAMPPSA